MRGCYSRVLSELRIQKGTRLIECLECYSSLAMKLPVSMPGMHCLNKAFQNQHAKPLPVPLLSYILQPGSKRSHDLLALQKIRRYTAKQKEDRCEASGGASVARRLGCKRERERGKRLEDFCSTGVAGANCFPVSERVGTSKKADCEPLCHFYWLYAQICRHPSRTIAEAADSYSHVCPVR